MADRPPITVVLPTIRQTPAIDEIADQLRADDELLVVCDTAADPISESAASFPASTQLVMAGEPAGCSGKANAIAAGMETARHDRIVWTDDDFHHPPDWLDGLQADYERHGPTTEMPFFVGRDPLSTLLEPVYALGATAGLSLLRKPWAGAVIFDRSDIDAERFLDELRQTVSDDGLLSLHTDVTPVKRVRAVDVGGTISESLERHVRFLQIAWWFGPHSWLMLPLSALFFIGSLLAPVPAAIVSTLTVASIYRYFGVRRSTALLAYPALLVQFPLVLHALARRQFVWAGRRYRWRSRFSVTIREE